MALNGLRAETWASRPVGEGSMEARGVLLVMDEGRFS